MDEADDQQADPAGGVQRVKRHAAGEGHIGNQHQYRRKELEERAVQALYAFDELVEQHHRGVEACRAEAEGDAQ